MIGEMNYSRREISVATMAAQEVLDLLHLGSYVFSVEPEEDHLALHVQCGSAAPQRTQFAIDAQQLQASLTDEQLRVRIAAEWSWRLRACERAGAEASQAPEPALP